ncbi:ATPase [Caerostris extrusa]|uniref:ATPase n=1 Tax=Caerostris extrusa TaxID=172846 RepID=A0AAV4R4E2_CAEEX|nr:ATPase [Caerostris extrusa]
MESFQNKRRPVKRKLSDNAFDAFNTLLCERRILDQNDSKVYKIDRSIHDDKLIMEQQDLVVMSDWAMVLHYSNMSFINHLTDCVSIHNSLERVDAKFNGPCVCKFIDQNTQRYETLDGFGQFDLINPHDKQFAYIRFQNSNITANKTLLHIVHRETAIACRTFLGLHLPFNLKMDHLYINSVSNATDEVRSHYQFIEDLFKACSEIYFRERYCHIPNDSTYVCDRGVWRKISNLELENILCDAIQTNVPNLHVKEIKCVGQSNHLVHLRHRFQAKITDATLMNKFDTNLNLFPLKNGVWDFTHQEFRPIRWNDHVQVTADWDYSAAESAQCRDTVMRFMEQVLPVQQEREYVLHFFGRLLTGCRPEKQFLILTDKRKGNNGKSTFMTLMQRVFSKFSVSNGAKIICLAASKESVNSHDAGLANLKGVRLLVSEELKKNQTLNAAFLKAITGGEYTVTGRNIFSAEQFKYTWKAGIVLIHNEHDFPKFDGSDDALVARMVVCPFRSKFVDDPQDVDEEYTFQRDPDINKHFNSWRSSVLDILREYRDPITIPDSMREWKLDICTSNNTIEQWLDEYVTITRDENDELGMQQLTHIFFQHNTTLNILHREFIATVQNWIKKNQLVLKNRIQPKVDGYRKCKRNVIFGIKLCLDEPNKA